MFSGPNNICGCCKEKKGVLTCSEAPPVELNDGSFVPPVPYAGTYYRPKQMWWGGWDTIREERKTCGHCLVGIGGLHHPGCWYEQCPKCGTQAFMCGHGVDINVIIKRENERKEREKKERLRW